MIENFPAHTPEHYALKRWAEKRIESHTKDLTVPGQTVAAYDVLRGRVLALNHLLEEIERGAAPPLRPREPPRSGY